MYKRAIAKGFDPINVLKSIVLNPIKHYKLEVGILQTGDAADFIIVDSLEDFNILRTFINGNEVYDGKNSLIGKIAATTPNNFNAKKIDSTQIEVAAEKGKLKVIEAFDGELITALKECEPKIESGKVVSDLNNDILKIVVVNRYQESPPAVAFIKGFGLKNGAIASSVAHDSHNIVAVGISDEEIVRAINLVVEEKGGVAAVSNNSEEVLPLAVAGLMSNNDAWEVAESYHSIDKMAHKMGSKLRAPFMTMSFMALLVIPDLKLSDKGLFDGTTFSFASLFTD